MGDDFSRLISKLGKSRLKQRVEAEIEVIDHSKEVEMQGSAGGRFAPDYLPWDEAHRIILRFL